VGHQIEKRDGLGMWLVSVRRKMNTCVWWGNLKEKDHLEDPYVDRRMIRKWIFRKWLRGMD
jgi:hypothetical protein